MTQPQRRAITSIAQINSWNVFGALRRIVDRNDIDSLDDLSKQEAISIISRFKEQMVA
jgi:hypothetical protein